MIKKTLLASIIGLTAVVAQADILNSGRTYVGAGVGQTSYSKACLSAPSSSTGISYSTSCDDTPTAWRLGIGYALTPIFNVELNYFDLGKAKTSVTGTTTTGGSASESGEFKAKNVFALQVGAHTKFDFIDRATVFGKVGIASVKTSSEWAPGATSGLTKAQATEVSGFTTGTTSDNKMAPIFTVGMGYSFTPAWGLNAQIDYLHNIGKAGNDDVNATAYSVGVNYLF